MKKNYIILFLILIATGKSYAQKSLPDLSSVNNFEVVNRTMTIKQDSVHKSVVHLDSKANQGIAWLKNIEFSDGTIEFDVRGKNVAQASFVGLAYHGINDSTFDAIYFRPFNFQSKNSDSKLHCVQYISMPKYDWFNLRHLFNSEYEKGLNIEVDPDAWIHAKIVITKEMITVFVNANLTPLLVVKPLNKIDRGRIGFWVGNGSDGYFSNLTIRKK